MSTTVPVKDLDHLLRETLHPDLKIESVTWKPLTDPGENYGSLIYSVDAIVSKTDSGNEVLHLVVKLPPSSQYLSGLFNSPVCFWKELIFYRSIAKKFVQLQLQSGIEDRKLTKLIPRFYGGRLGLKEPDTFDDQAAIVLENLNHRGYSMRDRLVGLDLEHTELVVDELAKFHAIFIGLKIKCPEFFKTVVIPALVSPLTGLAVEAVKGMVKNAHEIYKELPEAKPYMERIEKTLVHNYDEDGKLPTPSEPWGTMIHHDFWSNNILFKYNDASKPIGIKIVDFQLGRFNSGAMDLIFLLISSAQTEVLDNNLDEMIERYYKTFIDFLKLLKIDTEIFSRADFNEQVNKCAQIKFGQCIMMSYVINAARETVKDIKEISENESFTTLIDRKIIYKKLLHTLEIFDKKRWFAE